MQMKFKQFIHHGNMKKRFTLIEMLIVLTVVAIVLPTVFTIVIVIMRQQVRIYKVVETRQGDYILTFIKDRLVRSNQMLDYPASTPPCYLAPSTSPATDGSTVSFLGNDDVEYRIFSQTSGGTTNLMFASPANSATPITINNNLVDITNFSVQCGRRAGLGSPLINVHLLFDLKIQIFLFPFLIKQK